MRPRAIISVKDVNGEKWGDLASIALAHDFVAYKVKQHKKKVSFAGGHRHFRVTLKQDVHWKIPEGLELDIRGVVAGQAPRRN